MGINLAKISDFFGLAEDEDYVDEQPLPVIPKKKKEKIKKNTSVEQPAQTSKPAYQAPVTQPVKERSSQPIQRSEQVTPKPNKTVRSIQEPVRRQTEKVVAMPTSAAVQKRMENPRKRISVVEPRAYSEAITIAKRVGNGETVLINFQSLDEAKARRVVDFLTGAVFMIDGDIKRVGNEMFLCTPANVEIDNSTLSSIAEDDIFGLGM